MSKEKASTVRKTIEAYNAEANTYEVKWEDYLDATHSAMLEIFGSKSSHRILDISAGTGLFTKYLIGDNRPFSKIVLNDVADKMLDVARERFENNEDIEFGSDFAENLSYESSSFDSVISLNAFHNYEDPERVLSEIHRVLKPGGYFYVLDWNRKGLFKLFNYFIKLKVDQRIQTLSVDEITGKLIKSVFQIEKTKDWKYSFWRFYLVKAKK